MTGYVDLDGRIVRADSIAAANSEAEFFRGPGLYETLLAESGSLAFAAEHFARLRSSARSLSLPSIPADEDLVDRIERLLAAVELAGDRARVNLRLDPRSLMIRTLPVGPDLDRQRSRGVNVISIRCAAGDHPARHKLLDRGILLEAKQRVVREELGEALLFDAADRLLEGASSSVFGVFGSELATPPADERILPGVTRAVLCAIAPEHGMVLRERAISRLELLAADEILITSAVRMLVPVIGFDGHEIGRGIPGPVSRRLATSLHERAFPRADP